MERKCLLQFLIFASLILACLSRYRHGNSEPNACVQCMNNKTCLPPDCFCCRDELNLPISLKDIPQIVFFTFDDALTDSATKFYHQLFNESRKNPNGCPVSMTLFVSHHDTVYSNVNHMYRKGMEIAAHSVSHAHMSNDNFMKEAQNQKSNLAKFGGIPENEIVGWRSPFLEPVGDMQPDALKKLGYTYDATLTFSKRSLKDKAPTPFTLDFGWPYDCKVKPCPKRRHFGFWEVPVVSLLDYLHKYDCVYVDGCNNPPPDEESAYKFLMDNFNSYHSKYRVPFGINMHPSWFYIPARLNAMDRFIRTLSNMDDVFIVSVKKMLDWLKNPTGLSQIKTFKPWQCDNQHTASAFHQKPNRENWRQQPDPITRRKNYIKARLEKMQAMKRKSEQAYSLDWNRLESNNARQKWWSQQSQQTVEHTHDTHHQKPDNHHQTPVTHHQIHEKPAAIAPWVHKKHDRPVKQTARIPLSTQTSSMLSQEVPFWKRKTTPVSSNPAVKRNKGVAWWEKAIPRKKTIVEKIQHENPIVENKQDSGKKTSINYNAPLHNHFDEKKMQPAEQKAPTQRSKITFRSNYVQEPYKSSIESTKSSPSFAAPPKVDFQKQLKEQELKQLEIIEKQKQLQKEQLRLQIEKLKKNNEQVFREQQNEEAKRMKDIERKQMLVFNQKQNNGLDNTDQPVSTATSKPYKQSFDKETTTSVPKSTKFSLFPDKNSKEDPWTRFVQFIIRNKP